MYGIQSRCRISLSKCPSGNIKPIFNSCSALLPACMRSSLKAVLTAGTAHHSPSPISSARYGCRGNPFWARGMTGVTRSAQAMLPWRWWAIHKPFSSRGTAMARPPFTAASGLPAIQMQSEWHKIILNATAVELSWPCIRKVVTQLW